VVIDFSVLAELKWSQPGSGVSLSEHAPLRILVRKVLKMTPIERSGARSGSKISHISARK